MVVRPIPADFVAFVKWLKMQDGEQVKFTQIGMKLKPKPYSGKLKHYVDRGTSLGILERGKIGYDDSVRLRPGVTESGIRVASSSPGTNPAAKSPAIIVSSTVGVPSRPVNAATASTNVATMPVTSVHKVPAKYTILVDWLRTQSGKWAYVTKVDEMFKSKPKPFLGKLKKYLKEGVSVGLFQMGGSGEMKWVKLQI
jgi:hypothetical protein